MKVICIDDKPRDKLRIYVKEGLEYEAEQSWFYDDCYIIKGLEVDPINHKYDHYIKDRFIPLSQIDETEFERSYNKELV